MEKSGEPTQKNANTILSAGNGVVFWHAESIILVDYLAKGKTTNGYYSTLLRQLLQESKEKHPGLGPSMGRNLPTE